LESDLRICLAAFNKSHFNYTFWQLTELVMDRLLTIRLRESGENPGRPRPL